MLDRNAKMVRDGQNKRQNKNRYVIAYLAWRVMVGLHRQITYMMQIAGHARCLIDANFAHIKRKYKRSDVESVLQLRDVVDKSAYSNRAVMFDEEDSWVWSDWKGFPGELFKPFKGIRSYQVFRFHAEFPGTVFARKTSDGEETSVNLVKKDADVSRMEPSVLPTVIPPAGLSDERRAYLYRHIRQFVRDPWKDITCPPPQPTSEE